MKSIYCFVLLTMCIFTVWLRFSEADERRSLSAPSYYLVVEARTCTPNEATFRGASNLPAGAILTLSVDDFDEDAWKEYSNDTLATVSDDGFFEGRVAPMKGVSFRRNLLLSAVFTPLRPKQASSVLQIVGAKGNHLGGLDNPQVGQMSGENYYLETIARVPFCGEKDTK